MTDEARKLGELKFTLLSNHLRGHLGPWDEKYRQMDVHDHLKDVLKYLVTWKVEASNKLREEYGRFQDHLAVVQMQREQGTLDLEGLMEVDDYIESVKLECDILAKLLEINL